MYRKWRADIRQCERRINPTDFKSILGDSMPPNTSPVVNHPLYRGLRIGSPWMLLGSLIVLASCGGTSSGIDCADCPTDQLCWTTSDFDGSVLNGCMDWPEHCSEDPTCDCVNDISGNTTACDDLGWVQNSDACGIVEERAVLSCVSTLG